MLFDLFIPLVGENTLKIRDVDCIPVGKLPLLSAYIFCFFPNFLNKSCGSARMHVCIVMSSGGVSSGICTWSSQVMGIRVEKLDHRIWAAWGDSKVERNTVLYP